MARRRGIRFIQYRIVGIELCDSFHPTRGVAFAKHPREGRLHEAVIVDGLIDHLPPPQSHFERHNAVELQPITERRTGPLHRRSSVPYICMRRGYLGLRSTTCAPRE